MVTLHELSELLGGGENLTVNEVSESDSIINFLLNESENYNSLILNESYVTEEERIVAEAKLQVIQEAVSGAIIAAIIALIGAIILFLTKFIGMMQKGSSETSNKINEAVKQASDNSESSKKDKSDFDKEFERDHQEHSKKMYNHYVKETINNLLSSLKSGSVFKGEEKYIRIFKNYAKEKMESLNLAEDIGSNISTVHMSNLFNKNIFVELDRCLETISRKYKDALNSQRDKYDSSTEVSEINKAIKELVKLRLFTDDSLNENVFWYDIVSDATSNNFKKIKEIRKDYIIYKFRSKSNSAFDLFTNIVNCNNMINISNEAIKKITEMNNGARKLQQDIKKYQSVVNSGKDYLKNGVYRRQNNGEILKTGFATLNVFYETARNQISFYQKAIYVWQSLEKCRLQQCNYLTALIMKAKPCIEESVYLTMDSDSKYDMAMVDEPVPDYKKYYK